MDATTENTYQVLVCHMHWVPSPTKANKKNGLDLPEQMTIDVPTAVLQQANKNKSCFNDIIEQFTYNVMTKKFGGYELRHCQIWLPLED